MTCKICGKLLSVKPRKEIKEKKTSPWTRTTSDFEEYQKFLEWKKEQKKRGTTRSPFLTNRSEKYERP